MTAADLRAIVVGTVSLDLVAPSATATRAHAAVGNSGANIAVRLAAQGWQVEMISLVGADAVGGLIREDLERWGVGTQGLVARDGYLSPRVFQVADGADAGTSSLLLTCPRCGRPRGHLLEMPRVDELPPDVVTAFGAADLTLCDVVGPAAELAWDSSDALSWFEASLREADAPGIAGATRRADVVKCSTEEADHYDHALTARDAPARLRVVTAGAAGVRWQERDDQDGWTSWAVAPSHLQRTPVDTVGAGDAWTVAAAAALATGESVATSLGRGADAAAAACLAAGARGDMLGARRASSVWLRDDVPFQCGRCDLGT